MATQVPNAPYVYKEYPAVLYSPDGSTRVVHSAADHAEAGPGWDASPFGRPDGPPPPDAVVVPRVDLSIEALEALIAVAKAKARQHVPQADADAQARADAEAAEVHAASVAVLVEKLKGAPADLLQRVKGCEQLNPKGARKSLVEALDAYLKAAE